MGMAATNNVERLRFGSFELSGATGELLKDGMPLKLQPQPFRVLRLLVSRPGELISREEIQDSAVGRRNHGRVRSGAELLYPADPGRAQ